MDSRSARALSETTSGPCSSLHLMRLLLHPRVPNASHSMRRATHRAFGGHIITKTAFHTQVSPILYTPASIPKEIFYDDRLHEASQSWHALEFCPGVSPPPLIAPPSPPKSRGTRVLQLHCIKKIMGGGAATKSRHVSRCGHVAMQYGPPPPPPLFGLLPGPAIWLDWP
jgi:hypothetical protein